MLHSREGPGFASPLHAAARGGPPRTPCRQRETDRERRVRWLVVQDHFLLTSIVAPANTIPVFLFFFPLITARDNFVWKDYYYYYYYYYYHYFYKSLRASRRAQGLSHSLCLPPRDWKNMSYAIGFISLWIKNLPNQNKQRGSQKQ